jgi:hypothetical protein
MVDRFDLEQQIMECWSIVNDISTLESQGASATDMVSLAAVYEFKFKRMWDTFEQMVEQKQFKNTKYANEDT